jgi:hypothetical protein
MTAFIPPTSEPVHIALRNGHTAIVTEAGNELPDEFHREAIARGCRLQGSAEPEELLSASKSKTQIIHDAIQLMLDGANEGDFTGDGKPNLTALSRLAGFTVTRDERDAAWQDISNP